MGWDIQINPTAESLHIRWELADLLDGYLEDFEIRYAALEPGPEVIAALRAYAPAHADEERAVTSLLTALESGEAVEVMLGH